MSKFATLLLLLTTSVFAQTAGGLAGISGVVRDPSGALVPNAKVAIANDIQGLVRNLTTNDAGLFTAPALPPASGYKLSVTASGFATFEARDVALAVGQNLDLNINLTVEKASTTLEVNVAVPLVETTKSDVSQVVDDKAISELPINGRRVDSFVLLTPGVSNDGTFGLLSFRGVSGGNSFLIDGNDTTEQYYNENAGRTRISSQVSQDSVQEFQVVSATFSAEYGRAMGGVVNTVTRSGANQLHGSAYWYFRNRTLNARDTFAAFNPHEVRYQTGARVGGAIIKDKLFYFTNFDYTYRNFPMVSSIVRAGVVDSNAQKWMTCAAPATPAQCAAIDSLLPRFFATLPRTLNQEIAFGRLDYHLNDRNSLMASFNYQRMVSPNGIQTGATSTSGSAITSNGDDAVRVRNGKLGWTSVPTSTFVNDARFGWSTDRQADTFDQALMGPGLGMLTVTVASQAIGSTNYLPRVQPNETRYSFGDNVSWMKSKHVLKAGFDFASSRDYTYYISNSWGSYTYQNVTNFALDFSNPGTAADAGKHWQSFAQTFGNPVVDATINDYAGYLQDEWRATSRLTLRFGARYEYAHLPQPTVYNHDYTQTGYIPSPSKNVMPRIGLAYRIDDKTVLSAGYGLFFARTTGALIGNLFTGNGVYQTAVSLAATQQVQKDAGPTFPNALTSQPGLGTSAISIQFMDPNLQTPYSEQGTISLQRQFSKEIAVTASYIWSRGVQLLGVRDLNFPTMGAGTIANYTINDASGNQVGAYSTPVYTGKRPDTRYNTIAMDENGVNSYYNAMTLQAQKRMSHGLWANVSYTWAHEIDDGQDTGAYNLFFSSPSFWTQNGNYKADKGSGYQDQRQRFVLYFTWAPKVVGSSAFIKYVVNGWQISPITTLATGHVAGNATVRLTDTPVTGMYSTSTLNGSGLSTRVPFWQPRSLYLPNAYHADVRITKTIPTSEHTNLQLNFECFNVSNTIAYTSLSSQAYTEVGRVLTLTPTAYGVGTADAGFPDGTQARRMQVSARFTW
jgi:hypothetical protein